MYSYEPTLDDFVETLFATYARGDDPALSRGFYVYDLQEVSRLYHLWEEELPDVKPYYAVKCNPDEHLIAHLAALGAGFDCASPAEIDMVLQHTQIDPSQIIYANPQKTLEDIRFAIHHRIRKTTLDSVYEIDKIASIHPEKLQCYIRIYANDPAAQCVLSNKYGATQDEWVPLLERARDQNVSLTGISFHVGSGAKSPKAFEEAIKQATHLHELAKSYGFHLETLDIGGGFTKKNFKSVAAILRSKLETSPFTYFIAEPGRYFAESAATLFTQITGRRDRGDHRDYYLTDSIYGSFNAILYDHMTPTPVPYMPPSASKPMTSTLYGATCDGLDTIMKSVLLPELKVGEWIYWPNMGAYTVSGASLFNGFPFPFIPKFYI
jgi:ornithine decarboxylase